MNSTRILKYYGIRGIPSRTNAQGHGSFQLTLHKRRKKRLQKQRRRSETARRIQSLYNNTLNRSSTEGHLARATRACVHPQPIMAAIEDEFFCFLSSSKNHVDRH